MVDGEILYQGRKHVRLDEKSFMQELKRKIAPRSKPKGNSLEAKLLPRVMGYFEAWDEDPVEPFHRFNSTE